MISETEKLISNEVLTLYHQTLNIKCELKQWSTYTRKKEKQLRDTAVHQYNKLSNSPSVIT